MNNNRLLDAGVILCKILMAATALVFLAATIVLVHLNTTPELYDGVHFQGVFTSPGVFNWNSFQELTIAGQEPGDRFALSKIDSFSLFLNYLQISVFLLFLVLILRQLMAVIRSYAGRDLVVRSKAFRKIARYVLAIFIITSFNRVDSALGHYSSVAIRFLPLAVVVGVYILSSLLRKEVAREQAAGVTA